MSGFEIKDVVSDNWYKHVGIKEFPMLHLFLNNVKNKTYTQ